MKRKLIVTAVALIAFVVAGAAFMRKQSSPAPQTVPITILPLGDGFPPHLAESDPGEAYARLQQSGLFSYYVDPESQTKIPIHGMSVHVTRNRSGTAWSEQPDTELRLWKVTSASGEIKLVSSLETSETYASKELVSVKMHGGRWLRLSPEYTWEIDPEYYVAPPGVLQDIYLTDSANVYTYNFTSLSVGTNGEIRSAGAIDGKLKTELEESFKRTYKNSVIGFYQTAIARDIVRVMSLSVDLTVGKQVAFDLVKGNSVTFEILAVDRETVSFRFGSMQFDRVRAGSVVPFRDQVVIQVARVFQDPGPKVEVRVHSVDPEKARACGVNVAFRIRNKPVDVLLVAAKQRSRPYLLESLVQTWDMREEMKKRIYTTRVVYAARALDRISDGDRHFTEWFNGNFQAFSPWHGPQVENEKGNKRQKYDLAFSAEENDVVSLVTGADMTYSLPRKAPLIDPFSRPLAEYQDYVSYPNDEDYIRELVLVVSSRGRRLLLSGRGARRDSATGHQDVTGERYEVTDESGGVYTTVSARFRNIVPGERATLYFEWQK